MEPPKFRHNTAGCSLVIGVVFLTIVSPLIVVGAAPTTSSFADAVIKTIPINALDAFSVTYDGANGNLYVPGFVSPLVNGSLSVISGVTNALVATPEVGWEPGAATVDYQNGNVYVPNFDPGCFNCGANFWQAPPNVTVISGATDSAVASIKTSGNPSDVTYDPGNGNLYVSNNDMNEAGNGSVSVVSGSNDRVGGTIPVGALPVSAFYDPFNSDLYVMDQRPYVGNDFPNDLTVVSGTNDTVIASIPLLGVTMGGLVLDNENGDLYAGGANGLTVISSSSDTVVRILPINGGLPSFVDAKGNVYVLQPGSAAKVAVINGSSNTIASTFSIGDAEGITYNPTTGEIYSSETCCLHQPTLVNVTSLTSEKLVESIQVACCGFVASSAYDPGNGDIYAMVDGPYTFVAVIGNASTSPASSSSSTVSLADGLGIGFTIGVVATVGTVLLLARRRRRRTTAATSTQNPSQLQSQIR